MRGGTGLCPMWCVKDILWPVFGKYLQEVALICELLELLCGGYDFFIHKDGSCRNAFAYDAPLIVELYCSIFE